MIRRASTAASPVTTYARRRTDDGNKRTALVVMLTFLEINGWRAEASDPELAAWIPSFSAGATPGAVATLLRPAMRRTD